MNAAAFRYNCVCDTEIWILYNINVSEIVFFYKIFSTIKKKKTFIMEYTKIDGSDLAPWPWWPTSIPWKSN